MSDRKPFVLEVKPTADIRGKYLAVIGLQEENTNNDERQPEVCISVTPSELGEKLERLGVPAEKISEAVANFGREQSTVIPVAIHPDSLEREGVQLG